MKNNWVITGGIYGFLGVALGAFGAHSLKTVLSPEMLEIFKTGIFYQLIHSVIITALGLYNNQKFNLPAFFFSMGIILFSFSLYAYSLTAVSFLAVITPFGGICFLAGWLLLVFNAYKLKNTK